jgi:hypothetical protein
MAWSLCSVGLLGAACGSPTPQHGLAPVAVLTLQPGPVTSVGVVEGDPTYELHNAVASVRLADGRLVVANAGSSQLLFFDTAGVFLHSAGRAGGGPGEFRRLTGLYTYGRDSLLAVDAAGNWIAVFDTNGAFARRASLDSVSGDSVFPADVWLYRRFWVKSALTPDRRRAARQILDRLPLPAARPLYRFAQLDEHGDLWIREPLDVADPQAHWTVVSPSGSPIAVARMPRRFEPHVIGSDTILGLWRDASDVNFIRVYALQQSAESAAPPSWLAGEPGDATADRSARLAALRGALMQVVTAEETYYADHGTYVAWADSLRWEFPEGITLDILAGDSRGWIGIATADGLSRICAMAVGFATPAGWPEGSPRCS